MCDEVVAVLTSDVCDSSSNHNGNSDGHRCASNNSSSIVGNVSVKATSDGNSGSGSSA